MKLNSQLSITVSTQLGNLQGKLEATLLGKLESLVTDYSKICPTVLQVQQLLALLNNVNSTVTTLEQRRTAFRKLSDRLTPLINSVTSLVTILRIVPIPTAVAGIGVPIGFTNRYAKLLVDMSNFLDGLKAEQKVVNKILDSSTNITTRITTTLDRITSILVVCTESNPQLADYLKEFQKQENSNPSITDTLLGPNNSYRATNGKTYFFDILEDSSIESTVSRRVAVAKDVTGVVVMRGIPSFSSSTKVLVEELKFRIENQLP
jgi:ABC-type transporter Mla subunit MlaD